jgi:hypothetical protein
MPQRPIAAYAFSLVGGIVTLAAALIGINSWFALHSALGAGFAYSSLGLGDVPSGEAIFLFGIGAICGISIIAGAVIQYSGERLKVRAGTILILVASLIGIPSTYFGMIMGGVLSVVGVVLGSAWRPLGQVPNPGPPNSSGDVNSKEAPP